MALLASWKWSRSTAIDTWKKNLPPAPPRAPPQPPRQAQGTACGRLGRGATPHSCFAASLRREAMAAAARARGGAEGARDRRGQQVTMTPSRPKTVDQQLAATPGDDDDAMVLPEFAPSARPTS